MRRIILAGILATLFAKGPTDARSAVALAVAGSAGAHAGGGGFISTTPAFGGPCEETEEIIGPHGEWLGIRTLPCEEASKREIERARRNSRRLSGSN